MPAIVDWHLVKNFSEDAWRLVRKIHGRLSKKNPRSFKDGKNVQKGMLLGFSSTSANDFDDFLSQICAYFYHSVSKNRLFKQNLFLSF